MLVYGKGRIANEVYLSYGKSGKAFAAARIREEWTDQKGEVHQGAFVNVVAFEELAERFAEQLEGTMLDFRGQLRFQENDYYSSPDGKHPYQAQVVLQSFEVVAGSPEEEDLPF